MAAHRFDDLDGVIDEVHALFDAWDATGTFAACMDEFGLHVLRLAVHEWMANLVQHADFGGRRPQICLDVEADPAGVRCRIEDNSDGFDFHRQIEQQGAVVSGPEPSERGRGLLMLIACTEDLAYAPAGHPAEGRVAEGHVAEGRVAERRGEGYGAGGVQRLSFLIRNPAEPVGVGPLFHLPDEA